MSRFKQSARAQAFTDDELHTMPLDLLRLHARETDLFARALTSEAARAVRIYKRRKRAVPAASNPHDDTRLHET